MNLKHTILSGSAVAAASAWEFTKMGDRTAPAAEPAPDPALHEQLQRRAYDEAYATGLAEGRAAGLREFATKGQQLERLLATLTRPFEALDDSIECALATLVTTLVRQLLRREIRTEPGEIVAVVREAMALLPVAARNICVHLHPDDATLVREALAGFGSGDERPWRLVEDPLAGRGGCKVTTDDSYIDASLDSRLAKLFAQTFGDERVRDEAGENAR
ncbi:MAG: flagellar assembly protein FliH [Porticoccaceae bacterium]